VFDVIFAFISASVRKATAWCSARWAICRFHD